MPTLEPFDSTRPLKCATRFIRLRGTLYQKGDAIPFDEADRRVIERLYDQRKITYGDGVEPDRRSPSEKARTANVELRQQRRGEKVGAAAEPGTDVDDDAEAAAAEKLAKAHTKDALFKKASGLAGVTKDQTKAEIALALVRAGRGDS